jgi:hypothetical protein
MLLALALNRYEMFYVDMMLEHGALDHLWIQQQQF